MNSAASYVKALSRMGLSVAAKDGYAEKDIVAAEKRLGFALPKVMREYYRTVGRHAINSCHNRLARLNGKAAEFDPVLSVRGKWLYFCEENQVVVEWAIKVAECKKSNPAVFADQSGEATAVRREGSCLDFLISNLYFQGAMGGAACMGSTNISKAHAALIAKKYESLVKTAGMHAYGNDAVVIGVSHPEIYVAASTKAAFLELQGLLKIDWNYSTLDEKRG